MRVKRIRRNYIIFVLLIISLGLLSRNSSIPDWIYPYLGDILYSLMFYFIFRSVFLKFPAFKIALITILFCYLIELSQLYQADWINEIRSFKLGGLILGYGFLWRDLISYIIGGIIGLLIDRQIFAKKME